MNRASAKAITLEITLRWRNTFEHVSGGPGGYRMIGTHTGRMASQNGNVYEVSTADFHTGQITRVEHHRGPDMLMGALQKEELQAALARYHTDYARRFLERYAEVDAELAFAAISKKVVLHGG